MTGVVAGFDGLAGAGQAGTAATPPPDGTAATPPPDGVRTMPGRSPHATRLVLVRHGEAVCNVTGVCGGPLGCQGLSERGRRQVEGLRHRLLVTGELAGTDALYASVLPRAIETARLLAPALAGPPSGSGGGNPAVPEVVTECGLCELHPGEADGLSWAAFTERFGPVDWDADPSQPIAPGGESWTGFVGRVALALDAVVAGRSGQLVVVACHAGVVEASLLSKLPVAGGDTGARLGLRTEHASLTTWEIDGGGWRLLGYNDAAHHVALAPESAHPSVQQA